MDEYKVQVDAYSGPLDLLLFLIRRSEVDIYDIPIAQVTQQYIHYVALLNEIDPEVISEFLVLAATLMEIKSRTLLPRPPVEESDAITIDPRAELVRQLLEYKEIKDASRALDALAEDRARQFARSPVLPPRDENELELDEVDIWALFEVFQKLLEQTGKSGPYHKVPVDDTPLALHAADILDALERSGGSRDFEGVFTGRPRGEMIGLFLALLELIRQRKVRASQDRSFGSIWLHRLSDEEAAALGDAEKDRPEYHEYDDIHLSRADEPVDSDESDDFPDDDLTGDGAPLDQIEFDDDLLDLESPSGKRADRTPVEPDPPIHAEEMAVGATVVVRAPKTRKKRAKPVTVEFEGQSAHETE